MAKLSDEKIAAIKKRYEEVGIYSQVAKELGCSPATVKKYVSEVVAVPTAKKEVKRFEGAPLPIEDIESPLTVKGWLDWCSFTIEDMKSVESLKEEL